MQTGRTEILLLVGPRRLKDGWPLSRHEPAESVSVPLRLTRRQKRQLASSGNTALIWAKEPQSKRAKKRYESRIVTPLAECRFPGLPVYYSNPYTLARPAHSRGQEPLIANRASYPSRRHRRVGCGPIVHICGRLTDNSSDENSIGRTSQASPSDSPPRGATGLGVVPGFGRSHTKHIRHPALGYRLPHMCSSGLQRAGRSHGWPRPQVPHRHAHRLAGTLHSGSPRQAQFTWKTRTRPKSDDMGRPPLQPKMLRSLPFPYSVSPATHAVFSSSGINAPCDAQAKWCE